MSPEDPLAALAGQTRQADEHPPAHDALEQYARELEATVKLNTAMRQANSRQQTLEILITESLKAFSAEAAGIYEMKGGALVYTAGTGLSSPPPGRVPATPDRILGRAWLSDRVLFFDTATSVDEDCDFCGSLNREGMQYVLVTPLRTPQATIGVLFVAGRGMVRFTPNEQQLLSAFSDAGGNTLQRFQMMDELQKTLDHRDRELQLLYSLIAIAGETSEHEEILEKALKEILQAVNCHMGVIHVVDPLDNRLKIAAEVDFSDGFKNYLEVSGVSKQLWQQVYRTEKVLQVRNLPDHRPFPEVSEFGRLFYSYIGFPIRIKGRMAGVLSIFGNPASPLDPVVDQVGRSVAEGLGLSIESARLRKQARNAVVVEERQRLARNLHDSISQSLYTLVILADVSGKLLRIKDYPGLKEQLKYIGEMALQAVKEMRLMLYEFRPPSLERDGLAGALEERLNSVECRAGIQVSLEIGEGIRLAPQAEHEVYRIAIEALNNSLRHSGSTAVSLSLKKEGEQICLEVQDSGYGFDPSLTSTIGGIGLKSMRERARLLGGTLTIVTAPDQGTCVRLVAPVKSMQA